MSTHDMTDLQQVLSRLELLSMTATTLARFGSNTGRERMATLLELLSGVAENAAEARERVARAMGIES